MIPRIWSLYSISFFADQIADQIVLLVFSIKQFYNSWKRQQFAKLMSVSRVSGAVIGHEFAEFVVFNV